MPEFNVEKAKQLLAQAGFPNGFEFEWFVPFVPYFDMGERILTDLRAVGIRGKLQSLEGPAFRAKIGQGRKGFPGNRTIVQNIDPRPGVPRPTSASTPSAAAHPPLSASRTSRNCGPDIKPPRTWKNGTA